MFDFSSLTPARLFLLACLFFILGTGVASFLPKTVLAPDAVWFAAAAIVAAALIPLWRRPQRAVVLAVLFALVGIWRYALSVPVIDAGHIAYYNGERVEIRARVAVDPDRRETGQRLTLEAASVVLEREGKAIGHSVRGKALALTDRYPRYRYGDTVIAACVLEAPRPVDTFPYDRYLERYGIYTLCPFPTIVKIDVSGGNALFASLLDLKDHLRDAIERGLPYAEAGYLRAMLLGDQREIDQGVRDAFSRAGLAHIAAISGMNITIVTATLYSALVAAGLTRQRAYRLASVLLAGYILIVGLPPSAVRAGIMGWLTLTALQFGRLAKLPNALIAAAALMLLGNPRLLRDDIGWQLSVLAVLSIAYGYPWLEAQWMRRRLPNTAVLKEGILLTVSAQLYTLPVTAYTFGTVSLIAPLANLATVWAVPYLTALGLVAMIGAAIVPAMATVLFIPARALTAFLIAAASWFGAVTWASVPTPSFSGSLLVLYALFLAWYIYRRSIRPRPGSV